MKREYKIFIAGAQAAQGPGQVLDGLKLKQLNNDWDLGRCEQKCGPSRSSKVSVLSLSQTNVSQSQNQMGLASSSSVFSAFNRQGPPQGSMSGGKGGVNPPPGQSMGRQNLPAKSVPGQNLNQQSGPFRHQQVQHQQQSQQTLNNNVAPLRHNGKMWLQISLGSRPQIGKPVLVAATLKTGNVMSFPDAEGCINVKFEGRPGMVRMNMRELRM